MSTKRQDQTLARVEHYRRELDQATKAEAAARKGLHAWIIKAVAAGVPSAEVARVAGVSRGRVSQLAPVPEPVQPPVHARKDGAGDSRADVFATVPTLPPAETPSLSGIVSTRQRRPYGRGTAFYDVRTGQAVTEQGEAFTAAPVGPVGSVASVLAAVAAAPRAIGRVYLVGPAPADTSTGATTAEAVRAWALGEPGPGWSVSSRGHYLADADLPTLRFVHESGARVTIMRAASWWGETDADAATCAAAWRGLGVALDRVPMFSGAGLADTPATTGRALWRRTIPEGKGFPVLSDELRELIASTSGQGRIELLPAPAGPRPEGFTIMDGRFMYAALTWGMPVGEPRRWTAAELDAIGAREYERTIRGRGRWRITVRVPDGWEHVGMFAAPVDGARRWTYPARPGVTFETWADGAEVWNGMLHGWEPVIHEGITWAEGRPLDAWRDALVSVWEAASASPSPAGRLAARAVRSVLLFTLGAFATRAHTVTRSAPADAAPDVPAGTEVRRVGESLVWSETVQPSGWTLETAHPEWSATVWARARARLLTSRDGTGALHLPPGRVVAFATDAIYLAGGAPDWPDDGKPGRFRVKGSRPGPFTWPSTAAELYALRDAATTTTGEQNHGE